MVIYTKKYKNSIYFKAMAMSLVLSFGLMSIAPSSSFAQTLSPQAVLLSPSFTPTLVRGIRVYPDNPFQFDFIVDSGDTGLIGEELKAESKKLIRYFLASLTLPENDLWVNLSPHEKDRIIPQELGLTEMGIDMLSQDYLLKKITASLTNPDSDLGKEFWSKVYQKAYEEYGTTNIPVDTFNKVWIMPDKATVYVQDDKAFITESKLKVMLEEDYVALQRSAESRALDARGLAHSNGEAMLRDPAIQSSSKNKLASQVVREVFIPALEKEVNEGKNFAQLRQIYNCIILSYWYKTNLKNSILNKAYANQHKVKGIDLSEKGATEKIYAQYLETFKQGVCNMMRVEYDPYAKKSIPRKYFAGGVTTGNIKNVFQETRNPSACSAIMNKLKFATIILITAGLGLFSAKDVLADDDINIGANSIPEMSLEPIFASAQKEARRSDFNAEKFFGSVNIPSDPLLLVNDEGELEPVKKEFIVQSKNITVGDRQVKVIFSREDKGRLGETAGQAVHVYLGSILRNTKKAIDSIFAKNSFLGAIDKSGELSSLPRQEAHLKLSKDFTRLVLIHELTHQRRFIEDFSDAQADQLESLFRYHKVPRSDGIGVALELEAYLSMLCSGDMAKLIFAKMLFMESSKEKRSREYYVSRVISRELLGDLGYRAFVRKHHPEKMPGFGTQSIYYDLDVLKEFFASLSDEDVISAAEDLYQKIFLQDPIKDIPSVDTPVKDYIEANAETLGASSSLTLEERKDIAALKESLEGKKVYGLSEGAQDYEIFLGTDMDSMDGAEHHISVYLVDSQGRRSENSLFRGEIFPRAKELYIDTWNPLVPGMLFESVDKNRDPAEDKTYEDLSSTLATAQVLKMLSQALPGFKVQGILHQLQIADQNTGFEIFLDEKTGFFKKLKDSGFGHYWILENPQEEAHKIRIDKSDAIITPSQLVSWGFFNEPQAASIFEDVSFFWLKDGQKVSQGFSAAMQHLMRYYADADLESSLADELAGIDVGDSLLAGYGSIIDFGEFYFEAQFPKKVQEALPGTGASASPLTRLDAVQSVVRGLEKLIPISLDTVQLKFLANNKKAIVVPYEHLFDPSYQDGFLPYFGEDVFRIELVVDGHSLFFVRKDADSVDIYHGWTQQGYKEYFQRYVADNIEDFIYNVYSDSEIANVEVLPPTAKEQFACFFDLTLFDGGPHQDHSFASLYFSIDNEGKVRVTFALGTQEKILTNSEDLFRGLIPGIENAWSKNPVLKGSGSSSALASSPGAVDSREPSAKPLAMSARDGLNVLIDDIKKISQQKKSILVAVSGDAGAGKGVFCNRLAQKIPGVRLVSADDHIKQRRPTAYESPSVGSKFRRYFDYEEIAQDVSQKMLEGGVVIVEGFEISEVKDTLKAHKELGVLLNPEKVFDLHVQLVADTERTRFQNLKEREFWNRGDRFIENLAEGSQENLNRRGDPDYIFDNSLEGRIELTPEEEAALRLKRKVFKTEQEQGNELLRAVEESLWAIVQKHKNYAEQPMLRNIIKDLQGLLFEGTLNHDDRAIVLSQARNLVKNYHVFEDQVRDVWVGAQAIDLLTKVHDLQDVEFFLIIAKDHEADIGGMRREAIMAIGRYPYSKDSEDILQGVIDDPNEFSFTRREAEAALKDLLVFGASSPQVQIQQDPGAASPVVVTRSGVKIYADAQGHRRIDMTTIKDEELKDFLAGIDQPDLAGKVIVYGGAVSDLLFGSVVHDIDYFLTEEITEDDFRGKVFPRLQATTILKKHNMGERIRSLADIAFRFGRTELSVNKMFLYFDGVSSDPVLADPQNGLKDLISQTARITNDSDERETREKFSRIMEKVIRFGLIPDGRAERILRDCILHYKGQLMDFPVFNVYKAWDGIVHRGVNEADVKILWDALVGWQDSYAKDMAADRPQGLNDSEGDLFLALGFKDLDGLRRHLENAISPGKSSASSPSQNFQEYIKSVKPLILTASEIFSNNHDRIIEQKIREFIQTLSLKSFKEDDQEVEETLGFMIEELVANSIDSILAIYDDTLSVPSEIRAKKKAQEQKITLFVESDDKSLSIKISDTGLGVYSQSDDKVLKDNQKYKGSYGEAIAMSQRYIGELFDGAEIIFDLGGEKGRSLDDGSVVTIRIPFASIIEVGEVLVKRQTSKQKSSSAATFTNISTIGFKNLDKRYIQKILKDPEQYLLKYQKGGAPEETFQSWDPSALALMFNVVWAKDQESNKGRYVLAVTEVGSDSRKLDTWIVTDGQGHYTSTKQQKWATWGSSEFNANDYDTYASGTYAFFEDQGVAPIDVKSSFICDHEGDASGWIEPPMTSSITPKKDPEKNEKLGGIDFKASSMNVQLEGKSMDFVLPQDMNVENLADVQGLKPFIINIQPLHSLPSFLGLSQDPQPPKLSSS